MINKQNIPYWAIAAGIGLAVFTPSETLSAEEKRAGVVTFQSMGRLLILGGVAVVVARILQKNQ